MKFYFASVHPIPQRHPGHPNFCAASDNFNIPIPLLNYINIYKYLLKHEFIYNITPKLSDLTNLMMFSIVDSIIEFCRKTFWKKNL